MASKPHTGELQFALRGGSISVPEPRGRLTAHAPLAKLTWFMQAVCLPSTFFVFVLYWGLVFDGELQAIACFTHGVNFAVMMADAYASGFPVLLAHALYFMIYAALYLCWTFVHYQSGVGNEKGEPYIYSAVNWAHPDAVKALAVSRILHTLRSIWASDRLEIPREHCLKRTRVCR